MPFAKLVPAFTARLPILPPNNVGSAKGGLNHVTILSAADCGDGSFVSEASYPVQVNGTFVHGADYIRPDVDGKHLRLQVDSIVKQGDALLHYEYTGTIEITPAIGKVLSGAPDAATTPFGNVFTHVKFESGHAAFAALEHKTFVGAGRFVVEAGKPVIVEYLISEVTI